LEAQAVQKYFESHRPEWVFMAAARVGGIIANQTFPVEFLMENLKIEMHIIENTWKYQSQKLMFLASSCIYPKLAEQPISESQLMKGALESTNLAYAVAKIAGLTMVQSFQQQHHCDFISVAPTGLYGIKDNYHPDHSHVIPGLIRRFHEAKIQNKAQVTVWGSGKPLREFLYVDDAAKACLHLMKTYQGSELINIASDEEVSIAALAQMIAKVVGYQGSIEFDQSRPDGAPRKKLDGQKLFATGWRPQVPLKEGLQKAYQDFLQRNPA
jgi:GDP-L-fucose synthase